MKKILNKKGFTMVELMIAISAFSGVLIMIMAAYIYMSKSFIHAYIIAKTQTTAKNVVTDLTQSINVSGYGNYISIGTNNGTSGFCIGNDEYSYKVNDLSQAFTPDTTPHMVRSACTGAVHTPQDLSLPTISGTVLIDNNIYIKSISFNNNVITPVAGGASFNLTTITLTLYYGAGGSVLKNNGGSICPSVNKGGQFCSITTYSSSISGFNGV